MKAKCSTIERHRAEAVEHVVESYGAQKNPTPLREQRCEIGVGEIGFMESQEGKLLIGLMPRE